MSKGLCSIHGFGPKTLQVLRRKASGKAGVSLEPDKRGKHNKHHTVGEDIKDMIRQHIKSFSARHSHYSRQDNAGRIYLAPELSIARLYRMFLEIHDPECLQLQEDHLEQGHSHQKL